MNRNLEKVAIDLDETLINNPNKISEKFLWVLFQSLLKDDNVILITFRHEYNDNDIRSVENEIYSSKTLKEEFIKSSMENLNNTEEEAEDLYKSVKIIYAELDRTLEYFEEFKENGMNLWKAEIADSYGCNYLIDDLKSSVIDGCKKYGIRYFHPDDWFELVKSEFLFFYIFKMYFEVKRGITFKSIRNIKNYNELRKLNEEERKVNDYCNVRKK